MLFSFIAKAHCDVINLSAEQCTFMTLGQGEIFKKTHYLLVQSHSLRSLISARPSPVLILTSLTEICNLKKCVESLHNESREQV